MGCQLEENGNFGALPFFEQLFEQPTLGCIDINRLVNVRNQAGIAESSCQKLARTPSSGLARAPTGDSRAGYEPTAPHYVTFGYSLNNNSSARFPARLASATVS